MTDPAKPSGEERPRKKRLGPIGYIRAMIIARTAAVSWPEAKEMARRNEPDPSGPVDVVKDTDRPPEQRNRP